MIHVRANENCNYCYSFDQNLQIEFLLRTSAQAFQDCYFSHKHKTCMRLRTAFEYSSRQLLMQSEEFFFTSLTPSGLLRKSIVLPEVSIVPLY